MTDEEIDYSDIPPITDEIWSKGVLRKGFKPIPQTNQVTLAIDRDIIDFFKEHGQNHKKKINQLLRAYMEEHQAK